VVSRFNYEGSQRGKEGGPSSVWYGCRKRKEVLVRTEEREKRRKKRSMSLDSGSTDVPARWGERGKKKEKKKDIGGDKERKGWSNTAFPPPLGIEERKERGGGERSAILY